MVFIDIIFVKKSLVVGGTKQLGSGKTANRFQAIIAVVIFR